MTVIRTSRISWVIFAASIGLSATGLSTQRAEAASGLPPSPVCEILRPSSNVNTLWSDYTYTKINDNVENPSSPDYDCVIADSGDDNEEQIWGFTDPQGTNYSTVSAIYVHMYGYQGHAPALTVRLKIGGNWTSTQSIDPDEDWHEVVFTGTWSRNDLNSLELGMKTPNMTSSNEVSISAIYCEICGTMHTPTPTPSNTPTPTFTPSNTPTPTPLPKPTAIFQNRWEEAYFDFSDDEDVVSEGQPFWVYIEGVPNSPHYIIQRKKDAGSWETLSPTMSYTTDNVDKLYFSQSSSLPLGHYYYKVTSPGASGSDELTDEGAGPFWKGGMLVATPTPTFTPTNTPTPTPTNTPTCIGDIQSLYSAAAASWIGESTSDRLSFAVTRAGDVNGDGYDDLLISAPLNDENGSNRGQVYLILGTAETLSLDQNIESAALASFIGEVNEDQFGHSIAGLGDVNGDGYDDFMIGAPYNDEGGTSAGKAYLFLGKHGNWQMDTATTAANFHFVGESSGDKFGISVAAAGDVNGDGLKDFLIGASGDDTEAENSGQVLLFLGSEGISDSTTYLLVPNASFLGEQAGDGAGFGISGAGDVNGDGFDDIIIGSPYSDEGSSDAGKIYLVFGHSGTWTTDVSLGDADASFIGESANDRAGVQNTMVGDINMDGFDDFLIAAPYNDDSGADAGKCYLILGSTSEWIVDYDLSQAPSSFVGQNPGDELGSAISGGGDYNGDGFDDLWLSAGKNDSTSTDSGRTYIFLGNPSSWPPDTSLCYADHAFDGENASDLSGSSVAWIGDFNGDGALGDFVIGAPNRDGGGENRGQCYLLLSENQYELACYKRRLPSEGLRRFIFSSTRFSLDCQVSASPGIESVTLVRNASELGQLPENRCAPVCWDYHSTRPMESTGIRVRYTEDEIAGMEESKLGLFVAKSSNDTFFELPSDLDANANVVSATFTHSILGEEQSQVTFAIGEKGASVIFEGLGLSHGDFQVEAVVINPGREIVMKNATILEPYTYAPVSIAFTPSGKHMFLASLNGTVFMFEEDEHHNYHPLYYNEDFLNNNDIVTSHNITFVLNISTFNYTIDTEGAEVAAYNPADFGGRPYGMRSIALCPDFNLEDDIEDEEGRTVDTKGNNWAYFYFISAPENEPPFSGAPVYGRIKRYELRKVKREWHPDHLDAEIGWSFEHGEIILGRLKDDDGPEGPLPPYTEDGIPAPAAHVGGQLMFGEDGSLLLTTGDGASSCYPDVGVIVPDTEEGITVNFPCGFQPNYFLPTATGECSDEGCGRGEQGAGGCPTPVPNLPETEALHCSACVENPECDACTECNGHSGPLSRCYTRSSDQVLPGAYMSQARNTGAFRCQDLQSPSGKVLRIHPETGLGYPNNPFVTHQSQTHPLSSNQARVWALGLRNPFRASLWENTGHPDPWRWAKPGTLFIGDNGWSSWEEVQRCDEPGQNFGWPVKEGRHDCDDLRIAPFLECGLGRHFCAPCFDRYPLGSLFEVSYNSFLDKGYGVDNTGVLGHTPPYLAIPHYFKSASYVGTPQETIITSMNDSTNSPGENTWYDGTNQIDVIRSVQEARFSTSTIGGIHYQGGSYNSIFDGAYFFANYYAGEGTSTESAEDERLNWMKLIREGDTTSPSQILLDSFLSNTTPIVDIKSHPVTGDIYFVSQFKEGFDGAVYRIRQTTNSYPTTVLAAFIEEPPDGSRYSPEDNIQVSANVTPVQGHSVTVNWRVTNIGESGEPTTTTDTGASITISDAESQCYRIQMIATDGFHTVRDEIWIYSDKDFVWRVRDRRNILAYLTLDGNFYHAGSLVENDSAIESRSWLKQYWTVEDSGDLIACFGVDAGGDGLILALKGALTEEETITSDTNARLVFTNSSDIILQLDKDGNLEVKSHVEP